MDLETAFSQLEKNRYFIWDDFISPAEVESVIADYQALHATGQFRPAGVGKKQTTPLLSNVREEIRRDEICWLDPLALTQGQHLFWDRLEGLKNKMNEHTLLGLWNLEGHYSHYFEGGFYHKHLDRFADDDTRTISMVLYLNPKWNLKDGGELRMHTENLTHDVIDVLPLAGRLICFLSSTVIHEVLLVNKDRFSFAGWWKRRESLPLA